MTVATSSVRPTVHSTRRRGWFRRVSALDVVAALWIALLLPSPPIPLLWMLSTSLKGQFVALQQPPEWIPSAPTLNQYIALLLPTSPIGPTSLRYFLNSMIVSLTTTVLGIMIAVPAAYAFSRFHSRARHPVVRHPGEKHVPRDRVLIPLFILMKALHLVNTHESLILTYLTFGVPLSNWLLKGFYDNIPEELERAARIDGASRFKVFWLIIMPLSSPGIIATAIIGDRVVNDLDPRDRDIAMVFQNNSPYPR